MITPQEIQKKAFSRVTFGGYDMQAVDEFLDTVYADYASLYKDNALLKSKMKVLIEKIEEYRKVDDAMRQTLISAQNMANEMIANAKKQSEEMTSTARAEAEQQIAEYRAEAEQYRLKLEQTRRETEQMIDNGMRACSGTMSMLETLKSEFCPAESTVNTANTEQAQVTSTKQAETGGAEGQDVAGSNEHFTETAADVEEDWLADAAFEVKIGQNIGSTVG